jgi:aminoglycoside phosphotransferase (APT) family kinase protein
MDPAFQASDLAAWLANRLASSDVRLDEFRRPQGSGFSAETHIFTAAHRRDGRDLIERFVIRRETPDPAVYPVQAPGLDVEIDIQYRVMAALAATSAVPIAPLVGYEADPAVLGAPFFVMGFVEGQVPIENPLYTRAGFFVDATAADRRRMISDGLGVLARLHAIDWQQAGLHWLFAPGAEPGAAYQLDVWERYARNALGDRHHPLLDRTLEWLHANLPADGSVGLCWGDSRPGNMIWRDFECVCVTDFEAACIASPEHDLGWWLMFDRWVHEAYDVPRLPGEPTRDEQRQIYEELSGLAVGDTVFHEVFAAARYAAIVVRVMNRSVARGDMPADQTFWLHNPSSTCLAQMLDEFGI